MPINDIAVTEIYNKTIKYVFITCIVNSAKHGFYQMKNCTKNNV